MSTTAQIIITVAGWTGAICAVVAYGLVSSKRVAPDSLLFQLLNLVGAALLSVSATVHGAWPSAVVNVIWVVIGIFALRTLVNARRKNGVRSDRPSSVSQWVKTHVINRNQNFRSEASQGFAEAGIGAAFDRAGTAMF